MRIARPTRHGSRQGYALRDLIAVILITGVLLSIGIHLTQQATSGRRRHVCQNNQHQLATAMLNYEAFHGHFPGAAGLMHLHGSAPGPAVGYVPSIFAYIERTDLARDWHSGAHATPYMAMLICPSDSDRVNRRQGGDLSYVVNGGIAVDTHCNDAQLQASGVCFDQTSTQRSPISVGISYLEQHDGAGNTLLLTENLQAGTWAITSASSAKRWNTFVWFEDPVPPEAPINRLKNVQHPANLPINYARPSSNHPGGVHVHFCDGHYQFVADTIAYDVYRQMMTSNGKLWP